MGWRVSWHIKCINVKYETATAVIKENRKLVDTLKCN